ncbi:PROLINE-RICH RECEPTOR-LIKE PROTEIN KINASE PERK4 [Salix viminalis]|uniref:non-specific serine/threonine protein kinase n=1 Tax=Salix viminalis TaxID=40686 RepID=A0A9Q0QDX9_SALVM|nr:PROLINE-RICH RECEPTOR-LIKE PROTEIN KINASE PERK4 [Salix viminalis]
MLSWSLLLEDFHKPISWQKVGLDLFTEVYCQMARQLLSSNTNWLVHRGDIEFCSEVEVLSCAQHRNVVMLLGFCIEDRRRLLVYEYICNGSLDSHLYGCHREPLEWSARQKIAVGAARGLRYLHEECRVGCIVHRDLRPNNILITHDFEPLVGDFGLARWQPDGETVDLNQPRGQQCLTEWARPLLEEYAIDELIDPQLGNHYSEQEVYCMLHAASLCIRRDPHSRPRMSQVLRILEGDMLVDTNYMATPGYDVGNRSGRVYIEQQQQPQPQPQPTQQ